jgi:hypothetical protein
MEQLNIPLTADLVGILDRLYCEPIKQRGGVIHSGYFEIAKIHLVDLVHKTKQKLLDELLVLNKKKTHLKNEFNMEQAQNETVKNMITNNIFGNNNPVTLAAGQTVIQKDISISITTTEYSELEKLGVNKEAIENLKQIVEEHKNDKPNLKSKVAKWLGTVTTSLVTQGLTHNLPQIAEFIQHHFHL